MPTNMEAWSNDLRVQKDGTMGDAFSKQLKEQRKKQIEKLERDLTLMEAQQKAVEAEDLKAEALRDDINSARNGLDFLRVAYERELPMQSWEQGGKK